MTPEELFDHWGAAWATKDDDERARLFEACCTADVEFIPPDARPAVRGRTALIDHVGDYTAGWPPGVRIELTRPPQTHHGWSRGFLRFTFPHAEAIGCDIIEIVGGRIGRMLVFAEQPLADDDQVSRRPEELR